MNELLDAVVTAATSAIDGIADRSGSIFYSGPAAFAEPSDVYILGLNPGGSPALHAAETIGRDVHEWPRRPSRWSRYLDESWRGQLPGAYGMQPRIRHMFNALELDLRLVPASNVVFARTNSQADLGSEGHSLLARCWPFHEAVIRHLDVRTVLCFGGMAGQWVRTAMGAHQHFDTFRETNARGWSSQAHLSAGGRAVVTLTHPGRADWRNPLADPTPLVRAVLERALGGANQAAEQRLTPPDEPVTGSTAQ